MRDLIVRSTPVPIAARDYGGSGSPVLLLHGGGASLPSMTALAGSLHPAHRVVAVDLRGHGRSGDGPWDWDGVLDDLSGVVNELGLTAPAVVGMSLGGMLAALWAQRHPECPAAVNLDGNPTPSRPEQLPGLDRERAVAELDRLREAFTMMSAATAAPLTGDQIAAAVAGQRELARRYGVPEEPWVESFERNLSTSDGAAWLRPTPELAGQLREAMAELDLLPVYRSTRSPLLLVLATEDLPEQQSFADLYAAYRGWLSQRLDSATRDNPRLRVRHLPGASHAMLAERPGEIADLVASFLASPAG